MVWLYVKMVCSVDKYKHFGLVSLLPFNGHNNSKIVFLLHVSVAVLCVSTFIKLIYISALSKYFFKDL